jgi:RNA polymerase sigma-70 factor (ECF subfamily)
MAESENPFEPLDKTASFEHTNWFTIRKAGVPESPGADSAREHICQAYWYPIYFYVRRLGHSPEDAQDFTQEFFSRLYHKNYLQTADSQKGKFRSFLLMMLQRFMADEWDKTQRLKRGGGQETISYDAQDTEFRYRSEPADELTPDKAFERRWALALVEMVLSRLQEESTANGKLAVFQELRPFLTCENETGCAEAARKLEMTESNVKVTIHRLRHRFGELLREEIARTAATPEAVEEEIRDLFAALG